MECSVDKFETAFGALPRAADELHEPTQNAPAHYSPADFLKQAGMVIVVCLGLAMLAKVLVMMVGEY
jgi:hypothetical protein